MYVVADTVLTVVSAGHYHVDLTMSKGLESHPSHSTRHGFKTSYFRTCLFTYHIPIAVLIGIILIVTLYPAMAPSVDNIGDHETEINNWATRFGNDIFDGSAKAVSLRKLRESFEKMNPVVKSIVTDEMFKEMRIDVQNMLSWKLQIVEKAADVAEAEALKYDPEKQIKFEYYNAKNIKDPRDENDKDEDEEEEEEDENAEPYQFIELERKRTFDWPINLTYSSIHVPTNVYDKSPTIVEGIKWSDSITNTFKNNLVVDPFLSWQYFGSSTGFLRIYPAMQWRNGEKTDMYDCRMRRWFIQAAASPKDIVILLDGSGSMLGLRKEIARNVVLTILDTLTDNDYFTVIRFSDVIQYMVPCTEDTLVQATEYNIREFKEHLKNPETVNIANFTLALITAFELLQKYNKTVQGSQCNQAIMLITDGAPYTYKEIFLQYNHPNIPVRVFTYLIGREVTDIQEVNFMACDNRGYYTHVTTLAEVREQVQKYIPVMSRPIVLSGVRTTIWTSVYADISEVRLTDWIWEEREREKIRKLYSREREKHQKEMEYIESQPIEVTSDENITDFDLLTSGPHSAVPSEPETTRKPQKKKTVHLMTTVATPVFDKRNYSVRVADLLGVIGTDVPVREIIKLASPFKLGVNGYSFVITNNGHVLYHPDLRPLFQDMLKPFYSSVDMFEVELVNENDTSEGNQTMKKAEMRKGMIDRKIGYKELVVKIHFDNMRRVVTRRNYYYYGPLEKTPFILVTALPRPYGRNYIDGQVEVKRREEDWSQYFRGNNWRVHPDWVYCEDRPEIKEPYVSPEDIIRNFIKEVLESQQFRWRPTGVRPPIYNTTICEKDLVQSLVFDAKATNVFTESTVPPKLPKYEDKIIKLFGIVTTFVATRSGLTRFEDYRTEEEKDNSTEKPFYEAHTRATDELFYKRAVDFHLINNTTFVFSVPFDAGTRNNSLVTASHAIFLGMGSKKAPVAVVGLQFRHSAFVERFFNITSQCAMPSCRFKCSDERLDCYLLDNNGFVVVSEIHEHTGKFFGEIDYTIFDSLVDYGIYHRVTVHDYQAICIEIQASSGPSGFLQTPFTLLKNAILWFWGKLTIFLVQYNLYSLWIGEWVGATDYYYNDYDYEDERLLPNKTKAEPCVKVIDLYEVKTSPNSLKGKLSQCHSSGCDKQFIAQSVTRTNLILLAVYSTCPCETTTVTLEPKKEQQDVESKCYKMKNAKYRSRPRTCINNHAEEIEIKQCGKGSMLSASIYSMCGILLIIGLLKNYLI